jgi:hypothetical protein
MGIAQTPQADTSTKVITVDSNKVVVLDKDQLSFYSIFYKTNPNALLIDLLNKIPAVLYTDNSWTARGDMVTEFLINGNTDFSRNDNASLYNIPARFVGRIDLFEDISLASAILKFSDNEYDRAINFAIAPEFTNSQFGQFYGGYGFTEKWNAGGRINFFKGTRQLSIVANSNNVNETTFSLLDLAGVSGQNGIESYKNGTSPKDAFQLSFTNFTPFRIDQSIGCNTTNSIGATYFDTRGKLGYYINYFYNVTNNETDGSEQRDYISGDRGGNNSYKSTSTANSFNQNHRLKFRTAYYFDPLTIFKITAGLNVQKIDGHNNVLGSYSSGRLFIGETSDSSYINRTALSTNAEIAFTKQFKNKPGRALFLTVTQGYSKQHGENRLQSHITLLQEDEVSVFDTLKIKNHIDQHAVNIDGRFSYSEPLSQKVKLIIEYTPGFSYGRSAKTMDDLTIKVPNFYINGTLFDNDFTSSYIKQRGGIAQQYISNKIELMTGVYVQYATMKNEDTHEEPLNRRTHYFNVLPMANFLYKINDKQSLRIHFKSYTQAPSLSNMKDIYSFVNPLTLEYGNPELKQEWHNFLDIRYNIVNRDYLSSCLFYASAEHVRDYVGSLLLTITDPVINSSLNFNTYFTMSVYAAYIKHIVDLKSNVDISLQYKYFYIPGLIDGKDNSSIRNQLGLNLRYSSGVNEYFDFTVNSNTTYYFIRNSLSSNKSDILQQNTYGMLNVIFWRSWQISTAVTHTYNRYIVNSSDDNTVLWNASVSYRFLSSKAAELRVTVHDILNNNKNSNYFIADNYLEKINTNNIKRYAMVSLVYNL